MFLAAHKNYQIHFYFGSKENATDELKFETFRSFLAEFAHNPKAHAKIIFLQTEIYFSHDKKSVEELIVSGNGDKKCPEDFTKLLKLGTFCIVKTRSPFHQLLQKIKDKKIKFLEFQKSSKFGDANEEIFLVTSGKRISFFIQVLIDYLMFTVPFFEIFANFPFDNCSQKRAPVEVKKYPKGTVNVTNKWIISDRILKGKHKDLSKYKFTNENKIKKEQIVRHLDPNSEGMSSVSFSGEIFGKELSKFLRILYANNPDSKLIID